MYNFFVITLAVFFAAGIPAQPEPAYKNAALPVQDRVDDLLKNMTLEEKIGQMMQFYSTSPNESIFADVRNGKAGSILGSRIQCMTLAEFNQIQKTAVNESRLGIPLLFGQDVNHGFKTIFPITLAQSCSWSPEAVKEGARIAAAEASTAGIHWTFAPMADVSRDPRWGRIAECYGEDTYLNAVFARAAVEGFQGNNPAEPDRLAACIKHYVGYGAAMGGRDYQYTEISERTLRDVYLPPFHAGIDAGAPTIMSAFNDINGVPASANSFTLTRVLRNEWNFDGFVLSDWNAVEQLIDHGFAADEKEAARRALKAGVDMEMVSTTFYTLIDQVRSGAVPEELIDTAVRRILSVKFRLGLFENPYTDPKAEKGAYLKPDYRSFARKTATETMVLLKNDQNILPVQGDNTSIAVLGPYAESRDLLGWWRCLGEQKDAISVLQGLQQHTPENMTITNAIDWSTKLILLCVGEESNLFGENNNRANIKLPHGQETLVRELSSKGLPIVLVVFNGRPLDLTAVEPLVDAMIVAWHPGLEAGPALADLIFGKTNFSAKLTATFPSSVAHIPVFYNQRSSGRPHSDRYWDAVPDPMYPFGFGKSYTTFDYSGIKLSKSGIKAGEKTQVGAVIKNTGDRSGTEIVQLYIRDLAASVTRPVKELKGFKRIFLKPGESKTVFFELGPEQLSLLNINFERVVEPGIFHIWIAPHSKDGLKTELTVTE